MAHTTTDRGSRRVLEPVDRMTEILFGLIMTLTFTCTLSVAQAGRTEVRTMLLGALGCNLAWGVIDGAFYVIGSFAAKARELKTLRDVRTIDDAGIVRGLILEMLPSPIQSVFVEEELESLRLRLRSQPDPPRRAVLNRRELAGWPAVTLLVFLSTFPPAIPFVLIREPQPAMRVSNGVAVALLYLAGHQLGRVSGRSPLWGGIVMVVIGVAMVGLCILLGG